MRQLIIDWFQNSPKQEEFKGKTVLEIGSYNVNGSVRPLIENLQPQNYLGIDLQNGPNVDLVLPAEKLLEEFGPEKFDVVISTETLEHVLDWRLIIGNMKAVLKEGGYIYITVPTVGCGHHDFPIDCWRYNESDMSKIFADFDIIINQTIGDCILFKAQKPENYAPIDLSNITLYSMWKPKIKNNENMFTHWADTPLKIDYSEKTVLDLGATSGDASELFLFMGAKKVYAVEGYENTFNDLVQNSSQFGDKIQPILQLISIPQDVEKLILQCKPDVVKSDIEGAEINLFKMNNEVWNTVSDYIIEMHNPEDLNALNQKCKETRYVITSDIPNPYASSSIFNRIIHIKSELDNKCS